MFVHMCVSLCIKPYSNFCKRNWIFCHAIMANFAINVKTIFFFFLFRSFPVLRRKGPLCRSESEPIVKMFEDPETTRQMKPITSARCW